MIRQKYKDQVSLLLNILPEVAKEERFALHGGTAINLFVRDMPRLSVDIDLTYVPLEDRATSLNNIDSGLENIKTNIQRILPDAKITDQRNDTKAYKLYITSKGVPVKVEVNTIKRGTLSTPIIMKLCSKAQEEFEAYCEMNIVPFGELYGGKICAALDRQHPRDFFDIKLLLENEGFTKEVKKGIIFFLLGSNSPINQMINPNPIDQHAAFDNQFAGMTSEVFTYEDFEETRKDLIKAIHENLTVTDKEFLLSLKNLSPDWSIYNFQDFPAIMWKLKNLAHLKEANPDRHVEQYEALRKVLKI